MSLWIFSYFAFRAKPKNLCWVKLLWHWINLVNKTEAPIKCLSTYLLVSWWFLNFSNKWFLDMTSYRWHKKEKIVPLPESSKTIGNLGWKRWQGQVWKPMPPISQVGPTLRHRLWFWRLWSSISEGPWNCSLFSIALYWDVTNIK